MAKPQRKRYWLINGATHAVRANPRRRRATTRRRSVARKRGSKSVPAWVRAKGFSSWSSYMASIRPNGGGTVARKSNPRRRRRSSTRRRRRNPAPSATFAPNPRRRRRRYRRNPSFSPSSIMRRVQEAGTGALYVTVGKAGARLIRKQVTPDGAGTTLGHAVEIAAGVIIGMAAQAVLPRGSRGPELIAAGALSGVAESVIKMTQVPLIADALGDDGTRYAMLRGDGTIAGYVNPTTRPDLAGYVSRGGPVTAPRRVGTAGLSRSMSQFGR